MEESLVTQVTRYLKSQRRRKIGYQVLTCMASVVVFCTVYALILPAITISNELTCALEQHEHNENCYTMAPAAAQPELMHPHGAGGPYTRPLLLSGAPEPHLR